jgi:uncharacterized damage-inducible protein DinB
MKEICSQYASFNVWATEKLLNTAMKLSDEELKTEVKSSFTSIYATFLHMWDAESAWWQRIKLIDQIQVPSLSFKPTMQEVADGLINQSKQWQQFIAVTAEHGFDHVVAYRNSKKEEFKQPVWQILLHVVNHSTFHRGQIVTILRNIGVTEIPGTDYVLFTRSKK